MAGGKDDTSHTPLPPPHTLGSDGVPQPPQTKAGEAEVTAAMNSLQTETGTQGAVSAGMLPAAAGSDRRAQERCRGGIQKMHLREDRLPCNRGKSSRHSFYSLPPQHKNIHIKHVLLCPGEGKSVTSALPAHQGLSGSAPITRAPPHHGQSLLLPAVRANTWLPGRAGCMGMVGTHRQV